MHGWDLQEVSRFAGVKSAALVSAEGLILSRSGRVPAVLYAHLAHAFSSDDGSVDGDRTAEQIELHWENGILLLLPTASGLFILEVENGANIGLLRKMVLPISSRLNDTQWFVENGRRAKE